MDVLSDAMNAMRTGRPSANLADRRGTWDWHFDAFHGAGFHVVVEGSCRLMPPDGPSVPLTAGDVVLTPHGTAHGLAGADDPAGPPTRLLCGSYRLDRSLVHPLLADLPEVIHLPTRLGRYAHHGALRSAVELLGGEVRPDRPQPGAGAALPNLLDLLLIYGLRAWFEEEAARGAQAGWCGALLDPAVGAALRAMHEDPARPWTVAELGARAGLSRAAFSRRFSALVGRPPLAYLTWWRLARAARLLRDTDAPLATVAQQVGYASPFAFGNAFKREQGVSAGRYRRRHRAERQAGTGRSTDAGAVDVP